ncbi:type II secretion system secretin GspD [Novosphingobium sp. Gsoil 351]|uniref:type II secretion system secretin GspD n=1 Tax=Novosphingobium sp. Gsoil 351 TaxID=2675225 RepID=UPI0012B4F720|nr:type II secretion system secretin GspD [Novosphingobium sp. Gsoil 351]QGN53843.1 type II secretion system protein GspD [Novosphingobium sp. Gsoil 351]
MPPWPLALPQVAAAQYVLNVRDADVRAFVADAAEVTGRTFIVDGRVQGKVSVVSDRPLSRSEYFEVFLSTLRANGLVAVPTGNGAFRIQPAEGAASQPSRIGSKGAARNQMVTEVIRLRSIDAAQAVETLRPLVSREGSITANRAGRSLVLVDYADNVRRIRALLAQIDRTSVDSTQSIALDHAGAREIAAALTELIPAAGEGGTSLASVVAVDSSNTLLLRGDPGTIARLATIARQLDASAARGSEIKVVWLDYADAAQMVPMLERLVGGQGGGEVASGSPAPISLGGTGGTSGGSGGGAAASSTVTATTGGGASANIGSGLGNGAIQLAGGRGTAVITRYPGANAIVISAPLDVQRRLSEVIRQLDQRQDQVLVEAIIVEVSDSVAKQLGVQYLFGGKDVPFAVTNFSNVAPNIIDLAGGLLANNLENTTTTINGSTVTTSTNSAAGDLLRQNAINAARGAEGGYFGGFTNIGNNAALGVLINAVKKDSNSNILSTPHITTNNNIPASILFGQEIPVSTGEALSNNFDNAFRTIQRQNVGIELDVTPQINADNEVRLDLRQEVSSIVGPVSDKFNELIINKREIKTTITVASGEIAVLGGLLDDNERRTIQKVPLLGDIPVLGELFKSRGKSRVKTNLMIFIRPTILRSQAEREATAARRYGIIREAQRRFNPKIEPAIDELVIDYLGATPPGAVSQPGDVVITPAQVRPAPGELGPVAVPPSGQ